MKKLFTKQLFRVFTLLTLMLTTALAANAAYWLRGDYSTQSSTGWTTGTKMLDVEDQSGNVYLDIDVNGTFYFKIYNDAPNLSDSERWWGYTKNDQYCSASSIPWTFYDVYPGDNNQNMIINPTGKIRVTLKPGSNQVELSYAPSPRTVAVASEIADYVEVDKTEASAGDVVTITVTPPSGKWADKSNILAYATIPPSSKDAPETGEQLTIAGDDIATHDAPGEYTFTMPVYPKGAYVANVEFQNCTVITADMFLSLGAYAWTGGPIVPTVNPTTESGLTSNDYEVTCGQNNIDEGTYEVTITGKGMYTGTVTLTYSITKVPHDIIISQEIQHGQVDARPNPAIVGKEITLTATPDSEYELASYTVTPAEGDPIAVTETEGVYTFIMPNCDVTVFATFNKIPQLYLVTPPNWENDPEPFIKQDDGTWVIEKVTDVMLEFGLRDQDNVWYGSTSEGHWYDIDNTNLSTPLTLSTHEPFYIKQAGTWTITVNADWTTVTVTGDWTYNITKNVVGEGSCEVPTTAKAGDNVTITNIVADEGSQLTSIVYSYDGQDHTITETEGVYSFTMPASDVTVTATFTKIPTLDLRYNIDITTPEAWSNKAFELQQDGTWKLEMTTAAPLAFGLLDENDHWYGSTQNGNWYDITKSMIGEAQTLGTNERFYLPVAGKWTFTVNAARTTITITGDWDYAITINAEGCTVVTNPAERASAMETVTVTATPTMENSTGVIMVVDAEGETVEFDATNNTFVMPYSAVTITATYTVQKFAITLGTSDNYTLTTDQADNSQVAVGAEVTVTVTPNNAADFVPAGLVTDPALQSTITDNGDGTYTFTMPANAISITATLNGILHGVLFDANHRWATYYGAYNLVAPQGVEVYVVGENYAVGSEVPVTKINYIPADKGVLLYCPNDMSDITTPLVAEDDLESNIPATALKGSVNPMTLDAYENYVLYNDVFLLAEAGTLPAHRCYLPKPAGGSKMRLTLNRPGEGGVITAIEGIDAENVANVKYVNLSGMTSDKPFSGINIMVITRTDGTVETMKVVR